MGRIERDIKKKVKNTKEEYYAWYSKHKEQINQRLDESEAEIDLGNIKVKSRSKLYIFAGIAAIFIAVIVAISVIISNNNSSRPQIPDLTFGAEQVDETGMSQEELEDIVVKFPELSKLFALKGFNEVYIENGTIVMNIINGELETANDFYFVEARISYTDNFIFLNKHEYDNLEETATVGETVISYEAKGADDFGLNVFLATTESEDIKIYWEVSCVEGRFDEWMQIMFE